jgi:hypothetical protein
MAAVKQDWHAILQEKLNNQAAAALEKMTSGCADSDGDEQELQLEPFFDKDGLHFGPYRADPVNGLHFDAPDDTAAS